MMNKFLSKIYYIPLMRDPEYLKRSSLIVDGHIVNACLMAL